MGDVSESLSIFILFFRNDHITQIDGKDLFSKNDNKKVILSTFD